MQLMIAQKRLRYDGILLEPGEQFYASRASHVKYLTRTGKAKEGYLLGAPEPETKPNPEFQGDRLTAVRQEYQRLYGKKAWYGWDEDELREKINTYQRRDMRAE